MDNQQTILQQEENTETKKLPFLPMLAACLVGGSAVVYAITSFIIPLILGFINLALTALGYIPFLGLVFNVLAFPVQVVQGILSAINPVLGVVLFCALIGGIVVAIISLVKSGSKPASEITTLEKLLPILSIAVGALLIIVMLVMMVISLIASIISFLYSVAMFIINIVSILMG